MKEVHESTPTNKIQSKFIFPIKKYWNLIFLWKPGEGELVFNSKFEQRDSKSKDLLILISVYKMKKM